MTWYLMQWRDGVLILGPEEAGTLTRELRSWSQWKHLVITDNLRIMTLKDRSFGTYLTVMWRA